jgi:hypothetical protein
LLAAGAGTDGASRFPTALLLRAVLQVALDGVSVDYLNPDIKLPKAAEQELKWCGQHCMLL